LDCFSKRVMEQEEKYFNECPRCIWYQHILFYILYI
jgi:hypothetical protein